MANQQPAVQQQLTDDELIEQANQKVRAARERIAQTSDSRTVASSLPNFARTERTCLRCGGNLAADRMFICPPCDVATETERIERDAREESERVAGRLRRSGLPAAYADGSRTIEDVRDSDARDLAHALLAGNLRGLYLHGPAGGDKTTLAAATFSLWIANGGSGIFVSVLDLISDIQATFGDRATLSRNAIIKPLIETPLLVLDDIGKEKASDYSAGVIFQVLDGRYRLRESGRAMIVTSNWNLPQLCSRFTNDTIAEPIRRRLAEMTAALEMRI